MRLKITYIILVLTIVFSCDRFKTNSIENAVARVNKSYIYEDDIQKIVPEGASKADSTLIVNSYIDNWARRLLLMDKARLNLPQNQQDAYNTLVEQYETDLYTKAYLEALVKRSIDSSITEEEALKIYETNKESFKLNDELLKFRYISLPINAVNIKAIESKFKSFNTEDKVHLDSIAVQFKSYSLNDSIWVKASQVIDKISVLNTSNKNQLLKKSNYVQLKDSLNLYLIQINDVLLRTDYAPLEYVRPTVKQIIVNKRKLELIKQIENEIIKDAIKNKQFETFK